MEKGLREVELVELLVQLGPLTEEQENRAVVDD